MADGVAVPQMRSASSRPTNVMSAASDFCASVSAASSRLQPLQRTAIVHVERHEGAGGARIGEQSVDHVSARRGEEWE
ncbi:hypothetical protein [Microbacterium sp. Se63.02b]|uniref:hypothetical protein n=1 Tax=Microbacterium sp. Se63.02b TaxID=2709304 RepID=UPI001FCEB44C|nr:hypothetical protein [Microbacterium sp. Se63.02b]